MFLYPYHSKCPRKEEGLEKTQDVSQALGYLMVSHRAPG